MVGHGTKFGRKKEEAIASIADAPQHRGSGPRGGYWGHYAAAMDEGTRVRQSLPTVAGSF
jgi:serine/threonine protein kinase HipA of HipAB toxin-antitoxin module